MNKKGKRYSEYLHSVRDVIHSPSIQRLDGFDQHMGISRLRHSENVSYKSYVLAHLLGWDSRAAARAGLMHDMFYYNFREAGFTAREHCRIHPQIALKNAEMSFELSGVESDIIRAHMWLATWTPPKYKESYLVTMVDKYCAAEEFVLGLCGKIKKRYNAVKEKAS